MFQKGLEAAPSCVVPSREVVCGQRKRQEARHRATMNEHGRAGRGGEGGGTRTPGGAQIAPAGGGRGGRGPGWSPDLGKSGLPRDTFKSKIRSTGRKSNAVGQRKKREELRKKAAIPGLRADQMKRN